MDHPLTILIVDDSAPVLALLDMALAAAGHRTVTAGSVADALSILGKPATSRIDLILTDYRMPELTGWDLVRTVRDDPGFDDLPIFVVSSETDADLREGMEAAGANGWFPKPVNLPTLLMAIAAVGRARATAQSTSAMSWQMLGRAVQARLRIPTYRRIHG